MSKKHSWGLHVGFLWVVCLVVVGLMAGSAYAADPAIPVFSQNMAFVGYNDIQGRETLQVSTNENWAYAGHHEGTHLNSITTFNEINGTTILNITDPTDPIVVAHIPGDIDRDPGCEANGRSASAVHNFKGLGRDILVRNHECGATRIFEIFDITDRALGINFIQKVGEITGTPEKSCKKMGPDKCGGTLRQTAHKGYLSKSGLYYAGTNEPGFRNGGHLLVFDLSSVANATSPGPRTNYNHTFVGRGWINGQKLTETDRGGLSGHHPIVDEANDRVYMAYLTGGDAAAFDISTIPATGPNMRFPTVWEIDTGPPGAAKGHTVTVIKYELGEIPNFGDGAFPRYYALFADENTSNLCSQDIREKLFMLDVTNAEETGVPFGIETWQVPDFYDEDFCTKGRRFGPHQFNETVNTEFNLFEDKIAYVAYFNAGVRVIDISNPYEVKEVGYWIPPEMLSPGDKSLMVQTNDVDVDYRGHVYATDRSGNGFWILHYNPAP